MPAGSKGKRPDHRQALAAKVSPVSRLSVASERLLATIGRNGTLPTQAEIKAIDDVLSRIDVGALRTEGGDELTRLCCALVTWLSAIVRWPSPSSATEAAAYTAVWKLFEQLRKKVKLLTWSPTNQLLPPHIRTTVWAGALLRSDVLQSVSQRLWKETEDMLRGLRPRADACGPDAAAEQGTSALTAGLQGGPHQLGQHVGGALRLIWNICGAAYADGAAMQGLGAPRHPGSQPLRVQLVEAVRGSRVLEHLARAMAMLAMRRGAEVAAREQGGAGGGGTAVQVSGGSRPDYSNFFDAAGIIRWEPDSQLHQQLHQPHKWPPPAAHVDLTVCGPWSQHLLLAWGLHHLHALDGGGHCGLHPDMVRGLPPAWEPPAQGAAGGPQAAASTSRAGAAGTSAGAAASSGSSTGPRILAYQPVLRLATLLHLYARQAADGKMGAGAGQVSTAASEFAAVGQAGGVAVDLTASGQVGGREPAVRPTTAAEVDATARGVAAVRGPHSQSHIFHWRLRRGPVVRLLAARMVRAAVASAQAWQREQERGMGGRGAQDAGGTQPSRSEAAVGGDGGGDAGSGGAWTVADEQGDALPPVALSKQDTVSLALRGLAVYGISVRACEAKCEAAGAGAGAEGAAEEGGAWAGAGEREAHGRDATARLHTELCQLGLQVLQYVAPYAGSKVDLDELPGSLVLGLPPLPDDGSLPTDPPPRLAAALAAGYLPALERHVRRCGRTPTLTDMRLLDQLLGGPAGGPGGESSDRNHGHGQERGHEGCHDLLWLLAYGDRDQAGALVSSLAKALDGLGSPMCERLETGLTHGPAEAQRLRGAVQLIASVCVLLGHGVEVCDSMAVAGADEEDEHAQGQQEQGQQQRVQQGQGQQEQRRARQRVRQLQQVVCQAVREMRRVLCRMVYMVSQALQDGVHGLGREDQRAIKEQLGRAVAPLLCVLWVSARTALHRHTQEAGAGGGGEGGDDGCSHESACGSASRGGDGGDDESSGPPDLLMAMMLGFVMPRLDINSVTWEANLVLTAWQHSAAYLPPEQRQRSAGMVVDLAWCNAALVRARKKERGSYVPIIMLEPVQAAAEVARAAGDVATVQRAEEYRAWVKGHCSGSEGGLQLQAKGWREKVPEERLRLAGRAWLLGGEETAEVEWGAAVDGHVLGHGGGGEAGRGRGGVGEGPDVWCPCPRCQPALRRQIDGAECRASADGEGQGEEGDEAT